MSRFGIVSTYPPTRCGLATFAAALATAIAADGTNDVLVVRVDDLIPAGPSTPGPGVSIAGILHPEDSLGRAHLAASLDDRDLVILQHEFGIYGGPDGEEVLDLLAQIRCPKAVVLHTVLAEPKPHQRQVLTQITELADVIVVMTRAAQRIIAEEYRVPPERLALIPHGVTPQPIPPLRPPAARPVILTWGLIGPGKGIEWGIRALACIAAKNRPRYRILGQTHPKVLLEQGERYRESLESLATDLGVAADVELRGSYLDAETLTAEIAAADLVLLPYDSPEQATSGVLAEAVAAGKVVIATRFPHSIELLGDGGGILVGHKRPTQIARAVQQVIAEPERAELALIRAKQVDAANSWPRVAQRYEHLLADLKPVGQPR